MTTVTTPLAPFDELATAIAGRVLRPTDADYPPLATPWNVAVASAPAAVVAVATAEDVVAAVRFADRYDLDVTVQATGHGAQAQSRPALMIHTGQLQELIIDPAGTARVGAGVRWQQVLDAAAPFGFGALAGSSPNVGVVGYLTGGGLSPVARTYGFGSDHVTAFEVVTGDGELRRATATQNPALFWGLRGGKGALGIVTAVEFDLLPASELFGGCLYFDGADARTVAHAWREWTATLPSAATTSMAYLRLPAMPMVPPPLAGRLTVAVRFAWIGDPDEGERVIAPLRAVAPVILGGLGVMPFAAMGAIHADPVDPMPVHERALLLNELTADALDTLDALVGADAPSPQVIVELRQLGGAIARRPEVPSAISHRDAAFNLLTIGIAAPPVVEATAAHAEQVMAAMQSWSDRRVQANFEASARPEVAARKYDAATLTRLVTLAATYDPNERIAAARALRDALRAARG